MTVRCSARGHVLSERHARGLTRGRQPRSQIGESPIMRSPDRAPATRASVCTLRPRTERRTPMPRWLKRGMDASAIKAADAKVRETVESILAAGRGAQGRRHPRTVAEVRQLVAGRLQADAGRDRAGHRAGAASATSTTSGSRKRKCATSRRSSATPCTTWRWRRCPASCSATAISRSIRSAATCRAGAIRWSPRRTCRSSPPRSPA